MVVYATNLPSIEIGPKSFSLKAFKKITIKDSVFLLDIFCIYDKKFLLIDHKNLFLYM